jgi:hypothetical protein
MLSGERRGALLDACGSRRWSTALVIEYLDAAVAQNRAAGAVDLGADGMQYGAI